MKNKQFSQQNVAQPKKEYITELQARELIAAILANYEGIVRFRNIETTIVSITDFTDAQHNHSNASGGGQFNPNNAFTTALTVPNGGSGTTSLTGILKGNGAGAFTAIVPKAGSGSFYVAASSGASPTTRVDWTDGVITAIT